jgi:outer membrane immunogenic protein
VRSVCVEAIVTAAVVTLGSLPAAWGADLPGRYEPPAPAYTTGYDWSGPYLGVHLGFGWGRGTFTDPVNTPGFSLQNDISGVIGGGQFGYNYQYGSMVFGFEFDISGSGMAGDATDTVTFPGDHYGTLINAVGTLTARVGYAWGNQLFYLKGGGAGADTHYEYRPIFFGDVTLSQVDVTRWGWTIGVGWEYGLTPNWSAKVEYNYIDFGKDTALLDTALFPFSPTIDQQVHLFKFGLNYRLNGNFNNGMPMARYDGLGPATY